MHHFPESKWLLARDPEHLRTRATGSARSQAILLCTEADKADQALGDWAPGKSHWTPGKRENKLENMFFLLGSK
jgi:hypothetical protein